MGKQKAKRKLSPFVMAFFTVSGTVCYARNAPFEPLAVQWNGVSSLAPAAGRYEGKFFGKTELAPRLTPFLHYRVTVAKGCSAGLLY